MLTTSFLLLAAGLDCPRTALQLAISVRPVTGEALGGRADASAPSRYKVGSLTYEGYGVELTSSDPVFKELVLDQRFGLRHRCGNSASGPTGWNAPHKNLSDWTLKIEPGVDLSDPAPGSLAAEKRGAQPVFRGYNAGASWPVSSTNSSFFLGLMHPKDGSERTLIVAFHDAPQPTPALVIGKLPIRFDTLSIVPDLHGPDSYVNLDGFRRGRLTRVVLKIDRDTLHVRRNIDSDNRRRVRILAVGPIASDASIEKSAPVGGAPARVSSMSGPADRPVRGGESR